MLNQQEIDKRLDGIVDNAESDIDVVFAKRLKDILENVLRIHKQYVKDGEFTRTDFYKSTRYKAELKFIAEQINEDYQELYKDIQSLLQEQYLDNYLLSGYLFQMFASQEEGQRVNMEYTIPSINTINQAILNPIKELTLPVLLNNHRNETIRKINIHIAQSIQAGEGYSTLAERLQRELGFSRNKARTVARTEAGKVQTLSRLDSAAHAEQYADMTKTWNSVLDNEVRTSHRVLDDQDADEEGYFHYQGHKAKGPRLFGVAKLDINCRCALLWLVGGKRPELRRARNYEDADYQRKLANRIDKYMEDGNTFKQAEKKALKEIKPPTIVVGYQSHNSWRNKLKTSDLNVAELIKRR
jgi:SPP1 gp7 family putative phage head morphogenesis protein